MFSIFGSVTEQLVQGGAMEAALIHGGIAPPTTPASITPVDNPSEERACISTTSVSDTCALEEGPRVGVIINNQ